MEIAYNLSIDANAKEVYQAITTQKGIEGWWCKECEIADIIGKKSEMHFIKEGTKVNMGFRIDALNPYDLVAWTCVENDNPTWLNTDLNFKISEEGNQAELNFVHSNWNPDLAGQPGIEQVKQGWEHFLNSLKQYCEGGTGQPW